MALRQDNMPVTLEMGQVTGKPQFQALGWLYRGGNTLQQGLYHDTMPEESLLPPLSLLASVEQRRLAVSPRDTIAMERRQRR